MAVVEKESQERDRENGKKIKRRGEGVVGERQGKGERIKKGNVWI